MATVDAEEARIVCSRALTKMAQGKHQAAATILEQFAAVCVKLVQTEKIAQEQASIKEVDLSPLKVDLESEGSERGG